MGKQIWTMGHSTRSMEQFLAMLQSFEIKLLADVRHYPGSRRYPHFNKDNLMSLLPQHQIDYIHFVELGGRRKPIPGSVNKAWKNTAFRGYADYMNTPEFKYALEKLETVAIKQPTAYMCSEAVWWRCHRSLISDVLKLNQWKVWHIMDVGKATEHPYTKPARIVNGELRYDLPELFGEN